MRQYKGYYIDGVVFNSKQEIDEFIKRELVERYQQYSRMFWENSTMELSSMMSDLADVLVKQYGLSWDEIEEMEAA